mmetsp:Transcript_29045/g.69404  ORF Transcript_29045/g.69404 Transcript_29045/m.69404 type:complete len:238 (-) Transcript_29045:943-1656(-)
MPRFREIHRSVSKRVIVRVLHRRKPWRVEPHVPVDRLELRAACKISREERLELLRADGLELEPLHVVLHKRFEVLHPDEALQVVEEVEALLVGHLAEGIVRVEAPREVGHEPREAVVPPDRVHGLPQVDVPHGRVELQRLLPVHPPEDLALHEDRPSLVEPKVLPGDVGDEVAEPRVRDLVRNDVGEAPVAGEERRRDKGEARVLHPSVREARRQQQQVVAAPQVWPSNLLAFCSNR